MKKIMFNDKCGLTQAVLEGRKTMTRRIISDKESTRLNSFYGGDDWNYAVQTCIDDSSRFDIGEEVAVAQSYGAVYDELFGDVAIIKSQSQLELHTAYILMEAQKTTIKGWDNKMFVKSELMPHRIRITGIEVERLQDISDDDCIREGIERLTFDSYSFYGWKFFCHSPKEAFAELINAVSGKGTWESNPWVFVYEFELLNS